MAPGLRELIKCAARAPATGGYAFAALRGPWPNGFGTGAAEEEDRRGGESAGGGVKG